MDISRVSLDRADVKILRALQEDARLSSADLAERAALTASPCWRRVKILEEQGVISGYHARLDAAKLGYGLTAFVFFKLVRGDAKRMQAFERAVQALPRVMTCHRVSGTYDYQMMVIAEDLNEFGRYAEKNLNSLPNVSEMYTSFVLHEVKAMEHVPLPSM